MSIETRYQEIKEKIRLAAETSHQAIPTLIAVSKRQSVDQIQELYELGQRDFGENYVQELVEKASLLRERDYKDIVWHFIGHLQTNKVKSLAPWVSVIHTIDSEKLAREVAKRWGAEQKPAPLSVFVEVNIDKEPSKAGVASDQVLNLITVIHTLPELRVEGLMCIPSAGGNPSVSFNALRHLERSCGSFSRRKTSMGMSDDYEVAIKEGATHLRIGTALFGKRL